MAITRNDLYRHTYLSLKTLSNSKSISHNIFLTTKQENFLSAILVERLNNKITSSNFATQFSSTKLNPNISRADIVEFDSKNIVSHIETKYIYSTCFINCNGKNNAENELCDAYSKLNNRRTTGSGSIKVNSYIICYVVHMTDIYKVQKMLINHPLMQPGFNVFTYLNNNVKRKNLYTKIQNLKYSKNCIHSNKKIKINLKDEIDKSLYYCFNQNVSGILGGSCKLQGKIPNNSTGTVFDFEILPYVIEI